MPEGKGERVGIIYKEDHNGQGRKRQRLEQNGEINGLEALVELNELMQQKTLVNKLKITLPQVTSLKNALGRYM